MKLVIVESPTKTKSLAKYLGRDFEIMATMGHIRDLPKSTTGIEIKGDTKKGYEFIPEYVNDKKKADNIRKLQAAARSADKIFLASDPDREGEAIAWHTKEILQNGKKKSEQIADSKFERITFHSITKEAILAAMEKPAKIDTNLVDAQQARRVLDRIVGYQLSPVLWRKVKRGLSAGRVQSVAVRLVVEKEQEIEKFKPEEYWEIKVTLKANKGILIAALVKKGGKTLTIDNGEKAKKIIDDLENATYTIGQIEKKERKLAPHPPFKTSTLQQAAANVLSWSAKKTMSVAQRLYELGVITYHRTDSLNLVETAVEQIRKVIEVKFGKEALPEKTVTYKTGGKVVAQEAHEAIRPTNLSLEGEKAGDDLDKDEKKLYELIWRRTVACQMVPAVVDQTVVWIEANPDYLLRSVGEVMKFASWKSMYKVAEGEILPETTNGEKLKKEKLESTQKFTQPPARFNDASLIKELEKRGIGRPSTYAPTITTIIDRGYVERKERRFFATPIGIAVTEFLKTNFAEEVGYEFTANMEEDLDNIASGKKDWQKVLSSFYGPFIGKIEKAIGEAARVKMPVEGTGKPCPDCKVGEVVIRVGKFGKFYSCSKFPECKYTAKLIEVVENVKCEKCGGDIVVKKTRTGKTFYGCGNYPKCDFASWNKPKAPGEVDTQTEQNVLD